MTKQSYTKLQLVNLYVQANLTCGDGCGADTKSKDCTHGNIPALDCTTTGITAGPGARGGATCTTTGTSAMSRGNVACQTGSTASANAKNPCQNGLAQGNWRGCVVGIDLSA